MGDLEADESARRAYDRLRTPRNSISLVVGTNESSKRESHLGPPVLMANGGGQPRGRHSTGRGTDYHVSVNLPNGDKAKLFGRAGMSVESLIQPLVQEFQWGEYRVVLSSTRAPVNLEDSSAVLDGKEIDVEDVGAMRKKAGMEILESEKEYFKSLNNIIETYAEPLKRWRLHLVSQETLFSGIYSLRSMSLILIDELTDALDHWNETKTCIGSLLQQQPEFPGKFEEYSYSYTKAARLLKEKRIQQHDNGFTAYIAALRGSSVHSLESLLLVPNQRIQVYGKLLADLMYATPPTHHDHTQLQKVSSAVSQLLDRRTEALAQADNQAKLEYIQSRFTQQLHLNRPLDYLLQPAKRKKHTSTSTITSPTPDFLHSCGDVEVPANISSRQSKVVPKAETTVNRRYVQEGPVQLTLLAKSITKDRYLFLLSDILLTAKCKASATTSSNSFNLKDRQRLCDVWVAQCPEDLQVELSDLGLEAHCSFLVGWPLVNCVATFSSPQVKEMWYSSLKMQITSVTVDSSRPTVSVCIFNKATVSSSSYTPKKYIDVSAEQSTDDVIALALEQFKIEDDASRYRLWVSSAKEEDSFLLLGFERPYSIKFFMNTRRLDISAAEDSSKPMPRQFVLRTAQARTQYFTVDKQSARRKLPKAVSSSFVQKLRRKGAKDVAHTNDAEEVTASFGQPLDRVIAPDLPPWLQIALVRLYIDGPGTIGILRRSANAKLVRTLREAIDAGLEPDLSSQPVLAIGALIKEFLRHIPGFIFNGDLYTEWVACLDPDGIEPKVKQVLRMLERLPQPNQLLLHNVLVTFAKITENCEINQMHNENVAICVSPSLLSPADDMQVLKNEVPPLIQFMLEHHKVIFDGFDIPAVVKAVEAIGEQSKDETTESLEFSPRFGASEPGMRTTFLSSSNDELADDEPPTLAVNHTSVRSLSTSTPQLHNEDDFSNDTPVRSIGETSASSGIDPSLSSARAGSSDNNSYINSPQLPRVNPNIPPGGGQDARANASAWRGDRPPANTGSPAGSRLFVARHRQAQQRAAEAQQAAPGGNMPDSTPSPQALASSTSSSTSRTKLHSSATMFMDQLGRSPGIPRRPPGAELDSEAAAGTRNLQELYAMYSVKGQEPGSRVSMPVPPPGFLSVSLPTTPSHSTKPSPGVRRGSSIDQPTVHSDHTRRTMRHWYSVDEPQESQVYRGPSSPPTHPPPPPPPDHQHTRSLPHHRPQPRVAQQEDALFVALNQKLGLGPPAPPSHSADVRRRPLAGVEYEYSSSGSSSDSDDNAPRGNYLDAQFPLQHQTRSLGKHRGAAAGNRPTDTHISATMYSRRLSVPSQPARVTTKSFELPMPRQPVFEDTKFDEESYV